MKNQKEVFKQIEGDNWHNRNVEYASESHKTDDLLIQLFKTNKIQPKRVLEIGCSSGYKLNLIHKVFNSECYGVEPSSKAVSDGSKMFPSINLQVGTADSLPFEDNSFDLIIFGFCLCLCDRKDLFKIALEANRCLQKNGYMVISDFYPHFPFKNKWAHHEGLFCYKMDYSKMFSWNPEYREISNTVFTHSGFELRNMPNEKLAITILSKNEEYAYLNQPY
jgi:ubiquinone/menaquinone biosynthesis C-methylase UbiE